MIISKATVAIPLELYCQLGVTELAAFYEFLYERLASGASGEPWLYAKYQWLGSCEYLVFELIR